MLPAAKLIQPRARYLISVTPGSETQLFSANEFRATDGRPKDAPHWFIGATLAARIMADFQTRGNKTVIDYEHQPS